MYSRPPKDQGVKTISLALFDDVASGFCDAMLLLSWSTLHLRTTTLLHDGLNSNLYIDVHVQFYSAL